jgi:hypothetical protein
MKSMGESDTQIVCTSQKTVARRSQPADFANRIRALARDAGRVVRNRDVRPHELIELSRRIVELRQETEDPQFTDIDRWLRSAQTLIERRQRCVE